MKMSIEKATKRHEGDENGVIIYEINNDISGDGNNYETSV